MKFRCSLSEAYERTPDFSSIGVNSTAIGPFAGEFSNELLQNDSNLPRTAGLAPVRLVQSLPGARQGCLARNSGRASAEGNR